MQPIIIGLCGKSCSGKSTLAAEILTENPHITAISIDNFFKKESPIKHEGHNNWDCPESILFDEFKTAIKKLKKGESTFIPSKQFTEIFDRKIEPNKIILVEGFLLFFDKELNELFDKKIFVDVSNENMIKRRLKRDQTIRVNQPKYIEEVVLPYSKKFEAIQKDSADIILSGEEEFLKTKKELSNIIKYFAKKNY